MKTGRIASLILCVVIGALIGLALPSYRARGSVRFLDNFHPPYNPAEGRTAWTSADRASFAVPDSGCRPVRFRLRVRSPQEAGAAGLSYSVDGAAAAVARARPAWQWHPLTFDDPLTRGGYLRFELGTSTVRLGTSTVLGVGLQAIDMAPPDSSCRVRSMAKYAGAGLLLWIATSGAVLGGALGVFARNAERRTPNVGRGTPNAERRTPNAEHGTPNAERRTRNAERRMPNAEAVGGEGRDASPRRPTRRYGMSRVAPDKSGAYALSNPHRVPGINPGVAAGLTDRLTRRPVVRRSRRVQPVACALIVAALALVFVVWSTMKPPTQSPDEVDHVVRAVGLVASPWVAVDDRFCVPAALANPLVFPTPPAPLAALFFRSDQQVSREALSVLERMRFPTAGVVCAHSQASSYPPLYYGVMLAAAVVAHPLMALDAWDSLLFMRVVSSCVGALAWLPLILLLRPLLSGDRVLLAVLPIALAPMTGFITGAVNPDAVHIPIVLAAGAAWYRTLSEEGGRVVAIALLFGALLTKPPGVTLLLALLLMVPAGLWLRWWPRARAVTACRHLLLTGAAAYAVYFVWSPPAPPGPIPVGLTYRDGLRMTWERLPGLWPGFWGHFGYLDYRLPLVWYACVTAPILAGLVAIARRPRATLTLTWFALVLCAAYTGLLLMVQLVLFPSIGLVLQGRYFLPVGLVVPLLALSAGRANAYVLVAIVLIGNVWGWHISVMRYFADGWAGWWQALPFF